jgi:D-alanyl-D-alanine carboxypeptidase
LHGKFGCTWTPRQLVGFAANKPLLLCAWHAVSYSNTNYVALALLAERIDGKPYGQQLSDYIFRPLGLSHTSLPGATSPCPASTATSAWVLRARALMRRPSTVPQ